jgi:hypothetical protein
MIIDNDDDPIPLSCEKNSCIEENKLVISNTINAVEPIIKKRKIKRKDNSKSINRTLTYLEYYRADIDLKSYKIVDLKAVASHNRLHISGNKTTLIERIFVYFQKNISALKIQSCLRCFFVKRSFQLRGPGYHDRNLCVNETDFYTLEPLKEIPFQEFFSYKDENSFIYGFNVCSLMTLLAQKGRNILNPYNRAKIPETVIGNIIRLYAYSIIFFPEHINEEDKCLRTRNVFIQSPVNPLLLARGYYYGFVYRERRRHPLLDRSVNELDREQNGIMTRTTRITEDANSERSGEFTSSDVSAVPTSLSNRENSRRRNVNHRSTSLSGSRRSRNGIGGFDNIREARELNTSTHMFDYLLEEDGNTERYVDRRSGEFGRDVIEARDIGAETTVDTSENSSELLHWLNEVLSDANSERYVDLSPRQASLVDRRMRERGISVPTSTSALTSLLTSLPMYNTLLDVSSEFVNPLSMVSPTPTYLRSNTHIRFDDDIPPFDEHENDSDSRRGQPVATLGQPVATLGQPVATLGQPVATLGQPSAVSIRTQNRVSSQNTNPIVPMDTSIEAIHIQTIGNKMREIVQRPMIVRAQELFMEIDQLGNYTNVEWFHQLSIRECFLFFEFLYNYWRYRGQLPSAVKKRICPLGDPFLDITRMRMNEITEQQLRINCITVMERLIYTAYDIEDRKLGALHILIALTQVSLPARNSMLWLYESIHL